MRLKAKNTQQNENMMKY